MIQPENNAYWFTETGYLPMRKATFATSTVKDFLAKNPETSRTLVTGVAKAIEWERTTPREQVIAFMEAAKDRVI